MIKHAARWIALGFSSFFIWGCVSDTTYVPVENGWLQSNAKSSSYRVNDGDTLYSIAWQFGLDYRALAQANHLLPPYQVTEGQILTMTTIPVTKQKSETSSAMPISPSEQNSETASAKSGLPSEQSSAAASVNPQPQTVENSQPLERAIPAVNNHSAFKPILTKKYAIHSYPLRRTHTIVSTSSVLKWQWPARGSITRYSNTVVGSHGIDIKGRLGEPVHAASGGVVVYRGDGVRGYGNLIIIKHNDNYLSAYAFLKKMRVHLGERIHAGEQIAVMGQTNAGRTLLHFEIRRNGKPVNPLGYLH